MNDFYAVRLCNGGVEIFERRTLHSFGWWKIEEQYIADAVCKRMNEAIVQAREEGRKAGIEAAIKVADELATQAGIDAMKWRGDMYVQEELTPNTLQKLKCWQKSAPWLRPSARRLRRILRVRGRYFETDDRC